MGNKIRTTLAAINGFDFAVLTGKNDVFVYEQGKRVGDRIGVKLTVALHGNRLQSLPIKVVGADPLPDVTDDQIEEACKQRKYIYVKPLECELTIYAIDGMRMTATAKGAEILANNK